MNMSAFTLFYLLWALDSFSCHPEAAGSFHSDLLPDPVTAYLFLSPNQALSHSIAQEDALGSLPASWCVGPPLRLDPGMVERALRSDSEIQKAT